MYILDFKCCNGHQFEGWYKDREEYEQIRDDGDLTCPVCETHDVERVLSTGAIKTSKTYDRQVRLGEVEVVDNFVDRAIAQHEGREPHAAMVGAAYEGDIERLEDAGLRQGKDYHLVVETDDDVDEPVHEYDIN